MGASLGRQLNEAMLVEGPRGEVIANMRTDSSSIQTRMVAISTSGGATFSAPASDPVLINGHCQASMLRLGGSILFANPATTLSGGAHRCNGTLRLSADGRTWSPRTVPLGSRPLDAFAYSSLTRTANASEVGVLFETGSPTMLNGSGKSGCYGTSCQIRYQVVAVPVKTTDEDGAPFVPTALLPDVLTFINGSRVTSASMWAARREELKALLDRHILGTRPAVRPNLSSHETTSKSGGGRGGGRSGGVISELVTLRFEGIEGEVNLELLYSPQPDGSAAAPRPALITQFDHRDWALRGVSRGFVGVCMPTGDTHDDTWPFYYHYNSTQPRPTWGLIARRAYLVSLILDYITTARTALIDTQRISMFGHSRNGKQTLIAAAYDERIRSAAGSSPCFPIATPARFASNAFAGEQWPSSTIGAGSCASDGPKPGGQGTGPPDNNPPNDAGCAWWTESVQQYYGRAPWLPADGHFVTALIAPRNFVIGSAHNDHDSDNSFGNEQNLAALDELHTLLDCRGSAQVAYRPGDHVGLIDVNLYYDVFSMSPHSSDLVSSLPDANFNRLHSFSWDVWRAATVVPPPPPASAPLAERVGWVMGDPLPFLGGHSCDGEASKPWIEELLLHDSLNRSKSGPWPVKRLSIGFADDVTAELYFPAAAAESDSSPEPLQVVIVLPGYFYNTGFSPGHYSVDWTGGRTGEPRSKGDVYHVLASRGYAALAWDPEGMGARILRDAPPQRFYTRYPNSSRFARQMQDLDAALAWVRCSSSTNDTDPDDSCGGMTASSGVGGAGFGAQERYPGWTGGVPPLKRNVILAGYSIGGLQALTATALDKHMQIAAVASFSGWTPLRTDTPDRPTGGIARYSHLHGLLPRLGLFVGKERDIPFDVDELLKAAAPRPTLLVTPQRDADATYVDVAHAIDSVASAWQAGAKGLTRIADAVGPSSTSEFGRVQIDALVEWIGNVTRHVPVKTDEPVAGWHGPHVRIVRGQGLPASPRSAPPPARLRCDLPSRRACAGSTP